MRLSDIFKQNWHARMFDMSSCLNYRLFKFEHKFENYLNTLDSFNRISFSRYRCGNSKIPVVVGRYTNKPVCVLWCQRENTMCQGRRQKSWALRQDFLPGPPLFYQ